MTHDRDGPIVVAVHGNLDVIVDDALPGLCEL
jgi:hypothetical protein